MSKALSTVAKRLMHPTASTPNDHNVLSQYKKLLHLATEVCLCDGATLSAPRFFIGQTCEYDSYCYCILTNANGAPALGLRYFKKYSAPYEAKFDELRIDTLDKRHLKQRGRDRTYLKSAKVPYLVNALPSFKNAAGMTNEVLNQNIAKAFRQGMESQYYGSVSSIATVSDNALHSLLDKLFNSDSVSKEQLSGDEVFELQRAYADSHERVQKTFKSQSAIRNNLLKPFYAIVGIHDYGIGVGEVALTPPQGFKYDTINVPSNLWRHLTVTKDIQFYTNLDDAKQHQPEFIDDLMFQLTLNRESYHSRTQFTDGKSIYCGIDPTVQHGMTYRGKGVVESLSMIPVNRSLGGYCDRDFNVFGGGDGSFMNPWVHLCEKPV